MNDYQCITYLHICIHTYVYTHMYTYIHKGAGSPVAYSGPNKRTPKHITKFAPYFVLDAVGCGTALQTRKSRVRCLGFLMDLILLAALWFDSASNRIQ